MIGAKQLKIGMIIRHEGDIWRVMGTQHVQPGKGGAYIQTKLRNVLKGTQTEHRFRSSESVDRITLDKRVVQFLYGDGEMFHFMDTENYEQFQLSDKVIGDQARFLTPNLELFVETYEEKLIGIELPATVKLKVVETAPYIKTATATNAFKAAKMESGTEIQVPGFITEGEVIEVDTASGKYLSRAK